MDVLKRKILLENSIDRSYNSANWGTITASTFYINVFISQNMDDMGLFTDLAYFPSGNTFNTVPDFTILINKLASSGYTFPFMTGTSFVPITGITGTTEFIYRLPSNYENDYYSYGNLRISGSTDSKIEDVRSYNNANPFIVGFDMASETYFNYSGGSVNGVNRVYNLLEPRIYVFNTPIDSDMGTSSQKYGLQYLDYTGTSRQVVIDGISSVIPLTNFYYIGEGWNETNTSLSALTKEEYLFGIISPPEVQSDVFIDRGITTVMDKHLRLSEIKNLGMLSRYGNGYYNLTRQ